MSISKHIQAYLGMLSFYQLLIWGILHIWNILCKKDSTYEGTSEIFLNSVYVFSRKITFYVLF